VPTGLPPSTIEGVYGYTAVSTAGSGQTIAIVDAYNDPNAPSDLNEFSSEYGLPLECTGGATPPSCFEFEQVNQTGGSQLPASNADWDLEISLDIEWAHALAPAATILLVEANSNNTSDLLAAEQYAAENAKYVSNSWGTQEYEGETIDDSFFMQPGVSYFVAAGDNGGLVEWPSSSPDVISVGGTTLTFTSGGELAQETAWTDGGGGCSVYEAANSYQSTGNVNCKGMRATPDLALDANPSSGVSVYDSVTYGGQSGWFTVGGTSAATPMVAAEAAVTGADVNASYVYSNPANIPFRDITAGSNGYLASTGYDLATGLGAWSYTPGAPTGLIASSVAGGVVLSWSAPSGASPSGYTIWRGTSSGQETTAVGTVSAPATAFTDSSTTAGSTYYYEVQANDAAGVGPFSSQVTAKGGSGTSYTVTFNANGGSGTMAAETDNVPTALSLNAFTRSGYTFTGWNTTATGTGSAYGDGATYPFTQSATLYAQWAADTSYTVTFNANGGSGTMAAETDNVPTALSLNAFTRSGYTFTGWNTTATGTGSAYGDGATYPFTQSATLYAQWAADTSGPPPSSPPPPPSGPPPLSPSPPTVTAISPGFGPVSGGTSVSITGTGFSTSPGSTTVDFGTNVAAPVNCASTTSCTAVSPSASAGTVDVTVSTSNGTSTASPAEVFTYVAAPTITKITPTGGPSSGHTKMTIWGTGFVGIVSVHFGGKLATGVRVLSASELTAIAPSGSGTVTIAVSAVGGTSRTATQASYTYVPAPIVSRVTPVVGATTGGAKVTIWGRNFVGKVWVSFGGKRGTGLRVLSSSEITVTVPSGSGTVHVIVFALGGSSKTTDTAMYRY
jgi:uncharacterized repeat protein (TIGR02543 family)